MNEWQPYSLLSVETIFTGTTCRFPSLKQVVGDAYSVLDDLSLLGLNPDILLDFSPPSPFFSSSSTTIFSSTAF